MTWYRVDDEFTDSPKLLPLEDDWRLWCDCMALWLAAGVYCARAQTDGRIKRSRLVRLTPMPAARAIEVADALVDRAQKEDSEFGLWEREGEDYRFHDWLHYQPSADEIARAKEGNRRRQQRFRSSRRGKDQQVVHDSDNESSNALRNGGGHVVTNGVSNATPTRPDPTKISLTTFESSIPTAGVVDACTATAGLLAESAQEPSKSAGVHRDTGEEENAASTPTDELVEPVSAADQVQAEIAETRASEADRRQRRAWGADLAARRKRIGITAEELAKYLSVGSRKITAWEKGDAAPGLEEGAQCLERLEGIERGLGHLAAVAIEQINAVSGREFRADSERALAAALQAWRWGWQPERLRAVVRLICEGLRDFQGGSKVRPATVLQAKRLRDAAEELDAGAVPHNGRQPLKGAAFLDLMDDQIAAMRREDEQRRLIQ